MTTKIQKLRKGLQAIPVIGGIFKPKPKVAVLRLTGIIMDSASPGRNVLTAHQLEKLINEAFETPGAKAVALEINSPGGSPVQSALIAGQIRRLAKEKELPVHSFVEDLAASGGFWLACAGDDIYVQDSSIVGSVGVISASFGLDEFINRHGITRRVYTAGKEKAFLDPFSPEDPKNIKRLKDIQKEIHDQFKSWVRERRGDAIKGKRDTTIFEGQFFTGTKAVEIGFADGVGDLTSRMKELYGDDVKFKRIEPARGFMASLLNSRMQAPDIDNTADKRAWVCAAIDEAEARTMWQRYGL